MKIFFAHDSKYRIKKFLISYKTINNIEILFTTIRMYNPKVYKSKSVYLQNFIFYKLKF